MRNPLHNEGGTELDSHFLIDMPAITVKASMVGLLVYARRIVWTTVDSRADSAEWSLGMHRFLDLLR
jgi:hypothetical protein